MALREVTPANLRCGLGQCPGVYLEEDKKHLRVIGKTVIDNSDLQDRLSSDETMIRIPLEYFDNVSGPISRWLIKRGW
jgi:hypothetical protein